MSTINSSTWNLVEAVLDGEFDDTCVDLRSHSSTDVDETLDRLEALAGSGLFSAEELSGIARQWRAPGGSVGAYPVPFSGRSAA